jgi:hypothetical protein
MNDWTLVAAALLAPLFLLLLWLRLERLLGIDPQEIASAVRWCRGVLARPKSLAVIATVAALLLIPSRFDAVWFVGLPALAFILVAPLGIVAPRVVDSETGEGWWKPRWPGLRTLLAVLAIVLVETAIGAVLGFAAGRLPVTMPVAVLLQAAIAIVCVAMTGALLLFGTFRDALTRHRLAALAAVSMRLFLFAMLLLAAPLVWLWKIVPVQAALAEARGEMLPALTRAVIVFVRSIETADFALIGFVFSVAFWLLVGRVLWQSRPEVYGRT